MTISVAYPDVHNTRQLFLIVQAAVMPTSVFPAPHGNTMIPERARLKGVIACWLRSAAQDVNDAPISKHLTEAFLLVRTNYSGRFEINVKICVQRVVSKVVLFKHRILHVSASLFDVFNLCVVYLEAVDRFVLFLEFI